MCGFVALQHGAPWMENLLGQGMCLDMHIHAFVLTYTLMLIQRLFLLTNLVC